jgi:hypothetical protein
MAYQSLCNDSIPWRNFMRKSTLLAAILSLSLLFQPITSACAATQDSQASAEMSIIIEQGLVRFSMRKAVDEIHLQVFDQKGDLVFDSGFQRAAEVSWPLQTTGGEALQNGVYAYTLTIKDSGAESSRARRGHLIVDRAKGRDGADKLWVTSQSDAGVGAELTVARDETAMIAGTSGGGERTLGSGSGVSRGKAESEVELQSQSDAGKKALAAALAGTAGRIAKFTTVTDIGDSVMTESNGNIGIGLTTPANKLDVNGGIRAVFNSSTGMVAETTGGTNAWARFHMNTLSQRWAIGTSQNFNGNQFYLLDDTFGQVRMSIQPNAGEVSFPSPSSNHVVVQTAGGTNAWAQYRVKTNNQTWAWGTSQNFNGDQFYLFDATRNQTRLMIQPNGGAISFPMGNFGVGTTNPTSNMQVEGAGPVELAVTSRNERAILALGNTLSAGRYVWTVESGVRGVPGIFGIYNRTVNKSGLEIDGNLNVYVKALQITGGADLSEKFDVTAGTASESIGSSDIQPGMVVAIDPVNPGKLKLSSRPYDRRVAGVISGAGGVQPGMMMGQSGTLADGEHPVALSGRVYARVDASYGAIKPGDLLTSSPTPGHAMKVRNSTKAHGAIIGKAMTGLKSGKGLVLTLVTLQ